jgi:RNA polymerase sigma-70 factor (ECF subfamily)
MNGPAVDSRTLVAEILSGNRGAFQTFVERYQRLVSHVVFRMVTNRADREDLCQDVFVKVYQNLGGFHFGSKLSTWVARIAYNTCLSYLQKKRVPLLEDMKPVDEVRDALETAVDDAPMVDETAAERDLFDRVQAEMNHLPPQYRAILTLYHLDEMSYEEIVDVTGLPMGTVKSYLYRARQLLRERLKRKYELEDIWQQDI